MHPYLVKPASLTLHATGYLPKQFTVECLAQG
uniref:Uncharacterized protein n=1 Tax=Anguilla anguilla TaxID=7936 RepID=A0A0E9W9N2_ANGAN